MENNLVTRLLFLDIDGVLNSKQFFLRNKDLKPTYMKEDVLEFMLASVDLQNAWNLKYVFKFVPDLKVVISSAWRNQFDFDLFRQFFTKLELPEKALIGKTPKRLSSTRSDEISIWLAEHKFNEKFLVLDDHVVFNLNHKYKKFEYNTNSWVGLTLPDSFHIIKYFEPKFNAPEVLI